MFDITRLTHPLNESDPCGENPEYTSIFMEMEKAREGEPERGIGKSVIDAVEPDWKLVKKLALQLFDSTRDLRVAASLCAAVLHTDGFAGLRDGLLLIGKLLEEFWDCLHPELDPDDSNPAIMRSNALLYLTDYRFLASLKKQPLLNTKVFGKFSLNEIQEAQNHKNSTGNEEKQQYQRVEAAFREAAEDNLLLDVLNTLDSCRQHIEIINKLFRDKVGHANSPNFAALQETLDAAFKLVSSKIPTQTNTPPQENTVETLNSPAENPTNTPPVPSTPVPSGDDPMNIQSRDDVLKVLDQICEYYAHHEPGSPVPLILTRARNLVNKDFMEILQDLSPDSASQVEKLLFGIKGKND
jgi:type VI secretion system protein ImpA